MHEILSAHISLLDSPISNKNRKIILDKLGQAGSEYRKKIYTSGISQKKRATKSQMLMEFLKLSLQYIDHTIKANKRKDNLYHAYNLMKVENGDEISIRALYEMLEGQVAVLSSGYLSATESLEVLDALKASALYRKDQSSYLLYPNRQLPRFIEKNNIPKAEFEKSVLLKELVRQRNRRIVIADLHGNVHFNSEFRNGDLLKQALERLSANGFQSMVQKDMNLVLGMYERMFDHQSFTGRSGTFYKYEGLGCIYWHMVSKLLVAVEEVIHRAEANNENPLTHKTISRSLL